MMAEFSLTSVLHATDFSPASEVALDYAALLVRAWGAELLMTVLPRSMD